MAINTDNLFKHRFDRKNVTVHKKERVFKQYFAIDAYDISYSRFDGKESNVFRREVFERDADAVAILAYDIKTDEIALIEQFSIFPRLTEIFSTPSGHLFLKPSHSRSRQRLR